ncbi:uncharacterized protein B0H18DRAFT_1125271 [Fomitopsis serialis]|uniref:uncharacterized protein n=1 Tax=Fomitopsis serialis TaxID=139415 RepID=UPI002008204B|nr:uncharacterized protein B0H18DRAFT_1125271 [Neoantrodia serialis]KAH9914835.1 hypothetical protein B0H18DRAFT_1125271 [Neoantrodia serialis]
MLRTYVQGDSHGWYKWLPRLAHAYNSSIHSATGQPPYFLLYSFDPKGIIDFLSKERRYVERPQLARERATKLVTESPTGSGSNGCRPEIIEHLRKYREFEQDLCNLDRPSLPDARNFDLLASDQRKVPRMRYQNGKGVPTNDFSRTLQTLYDAELARANDHFLNVPSPPRSLRLRPADDIAIIQRHLLQLRAHSHRRYLQMVLEEGHMSAPSADILGIGSWVEENDEKVQKWLVWFGVPVWYVTHVPLPASTIQSIFASLDLRLLLKPWEEMKHGPKALAGKRTRKQERRLQVELDSADEDPVSTT